jgi:hypothetical protein
VSRAADEPAVHPLGIRHREMASPALGDSDEDLCDLPFPEGVGRYKWILKGKLLRTDSRIEGCAACRASIEVHLKAMGDKLPANQPTGNP